MASLNTNLNVGPGPKSATARDVDARLSQPSQKTEEDAGRSSAWSEFRLAVVGHLVFCDVDRGQLSAELKSLSTRRWKHPISGRQVILSYSTVERWYYIVRKNPEARLRALSRKRRNSGLPRSLTKQICHFLVGQAKSHSSWSYAQHHRNLI